ncbi:MAG: Smr/MutS family protein, partial [Opitutaceae bacterium]|nr:Smr/MutS family protein [Verrucomicrobiales bacterium]
MDEPIPVPINGVLDLHTFRPDEVGDLIREYVAECQARGILRIRIIHGKGTGQLRQGVHVLLRSMPEVDSFRLADAAMGGWG